MTRHYRLTRVTNRHYDVATPTGEPLGRIIRGDRLWGADTYWRAHPHQATEPLPDWFPTRTAAAQALVWAAAEATP